MFPLFYLDNGISYQPSLAYFVNAFLNIRRYSMKKSVVTITIFTVSQLIRCLIGLELNELFPNERDALIELRDAINSSSHLHANWTGPVCNTKNESRWAGVGCSDWHVDRLVLEGIQLNASLPPMLFQKLTFLSKLSFRSNSLWGPLPNLTNLVQLEYVFLSRNQFSGSIPSSYINLPKLTKLELQQNDLSGQIPPFDQQSLIDFNVSSNQLEGEVPQTPVLQRFPQSSYANNSALCGDITGLNPCPIPSLGPTPAPHPFSPSSKKGGSRLQPWSIALIAAAAALVLPFLIFICLCYCLKKSKKKLPGEMHVEPEGKRSQWWESRDDSERRAELDFLDKPGIFELDDLLRSAAQAMGRGNLGTTYKAILECGSVVAVKRLEEVKVSSKKEFAQHMHLLGGMKHQNLAEMISFYHSKEEKLIVYEYISDGSLFSLLHENRGVGRVVLDWSMRVGIIKDIANGLEHLHQHGVAHGNLKSSNVLIQRDEVGIQVKLTDYGFLGVVAAGKLAARRSPEFGEGMKVTIKADVYCFGIVILEIVTGRVPMSTAEESWDLSEWVRAAVSIDWSTDILDVEIVGEKEGYDDMLRLTEIALECTDEVPERRPNMAQILSRIIPHQRLP